MKKITLNIFYTFITLCGVFLVHNFIYKDFTYISWCEDLFEPYWACTNLNPFTDINIFSNNPHHSLLYSMPYNLFEVYLPKLLNIHPLTCFENITSYIFCLILVTLLLVISFNYSMYFKKHKFITSFVIASLFFPAYIAINDLSTLYYIYYNRSWMCGYFILPLFVTVLFVEFANHFVLEKQLTKKNMIILILLLFCVANSFEILRYIVLAFLTVRILLYALFDKEKSNLKKYLILYFSYIVFNLILVLLSKGSSYIHFINFHTEPQLLMNYFKDFFRSYGHYILFNNIITLALIAVVSVLIFFFVPKNTRKQNFFTYTVSLFLAVMSYPLMTIFFNFNPDGWQYDSYFHYACDHLGTRYVTAIMLVCILLSAFGFLISSAKNIKQKIISFIILIIALIPSYKYFVVNHFDTWYQLITEPEFTKFFKERRLNLYILEKFYAMYGVKNNVFYTYSPHNVTYYDNMIMYLLLLYSQNSKLGQNIPEAVDYKIIHICSDDDDLFTVCKDKMLETVKEKTGYVFTEEELEKTDFESIKEHL